jgi:hypothetical protein
MARSPSTTKTSERKHGSRRHDHGHDHGIVRDDMGQEQPKDKERARHVSRVDQGDDPPGHDPEEK